MSSENGTTPTVDATSSVAELSNWSYSDYKDDMRGTTTSDASTDSVETFPNNIGGDSSHTSLIIQKFPKKMDVELINPNLQFTCSNFVETYFSVKFDDGPVSKYQCIDAVGGKYGVAYFMSGGRIVDKIRKSKKLIVEAEVFGRGLVQMTFNTSGLKF